jgi:O-antigen/teichoic acid export membrane protein
MTYRSALKVTTLSQFVLFGLSLLSVVVVSRLLTPEEIGVFSVSVSLLGFAHIVREFGVGQYLVRASTVGRQQLRAAFTVALACAWSIGAIVAALSYPLSRLYGHEGVLQVLLLASANFIVLPFGTPSLSMLRRELHFTRIAWVNIIGATVQAVVTIGAAYTGQSYLSMAWGALAMQVSKVVVLQFMRPGELWMLPTVSGVREILRFGSLTTGATVVSTLGQSAPDLILGKTLGFADVAFLSRGASLTSMVVEKVQETVRSVFFPVFSSQLRSGEDGAANYVKTISHLAAITAPLLVFLAIMADALIPWLFGDQWVRSAHLATVICLAHLPWAPFALYGAALTGAGAVGELIRVESMAAAVKIALLSSSLWYGLDVVVYFIAAGHVVESMLVYRALRTAFGLTLSQLFAGLWRCYALALITGLGAWVAKDLTQPLVAALPGARFIELSVVSLVAGVCWIGGLILLRHPLRLEAVKLLRWRHG